jgi:hypothetical protein
MDPLKQYKYQIDQLPERHTKEEILALITSMQTDIETFCKENQTKLPLKNSTQYFSERHKTLFLSYNMIFHMLLKGKMRIEIINKLIDCRDNLSSNKFKSGIAAEQIKNTIDSFNKNSEKKILK